MKYPRVLCLHSFLSRVVLLLKKVLLKISRAQYIGAADADITQSSFVDSTACPRPKYGCVTRRLSDILPSIGWARRNRGGKYLIFPRGSLSCLIYWFEREVMDYYYGLWFVTIIEPVQNIQWILWTIHWVKLNGLAEAIDCCLVCCFQISFNCSD